MTEFLMPTFPLAAMEDVSSPVSLLRHFVVDGGYITWFALIPLSIATVALSLKYSIVLRRTAFVPMTLARALLSAARQGQIRNILEITRDDETLLAQTAYAGVSQMSAGRDSARAAIDEVVEERAIRLFRRIEYLNIIGNVSPMIGLFGTVVGMIRAFARIHAAGGGMPDAGALAGDIAVALVTTFWGLLIAIPALTAHAVFRNRIDAFAAECVKLSDNMVGMISQAAESESSGTSEPGSVSRAASAGGQKSTRGSGSVQTAG